MENVIGSLPLVGGFEIYEWYSNVVDLKNV
jgi:hypothetical protein